MTWRKHMTAIGFGGTALLLLAFVVLLHGPPALQYPAIFVLGVYVLALAAMVFYAAWLGGKHHSDWLFANVYRLPLTVVALIIAVGCALLFQDGEESRSALTVASVVGVGLAGALYARLRRRQPKA
ncbi:divalent metal cation (Fe/Co/Zn/Cd) transporter [Bradyrhizobium sp. AZCC 1610]|uniref:hypothetical protein n=1 Tax=Bradyrhizobium sp. AZCC 1610 TaxID=3117020 RepID=UPI002FF281B4